MKIDLTVKFQSFRSWLEKYAQKLNQFHLATTSEWKLSRFFIMKHKRIGHFNTALLIFQNKVGSNPENLYKRFLVFFFLFSNRQNHHSRPIFSFILGNHPIFSWKFENFDYAIFLVSRFEIVFELCRVLWEIWLCLWFLRKFWVRISINVYFWGC